MKINYTTQNFYGYNNVFAGDSTDNNVTLAFISANINNDEIKDLNKYKEINDLLVKDDEIVFNDSVTLGIFHDNNTGKADFFLNGDWLYSGEEMKAMKDNPSRYRFMTSYKTIESLNLKIYTFLASLTKRIMNSNPEVCQTIPSTEISNNIMQNFSSSFMKVSNDADFIANVFLNSKKQQHAPKSAAMKINNYINRTMIHFFK